MNVKRYTAETMAEAMEMIRKELGEDALILSNRTVRKRGLARLFGKPMVEVVAAYEQPDPSAARPQTVNVNLPGGKKPNPLPPLTKTTANRPGDAAVSKPPLANPAAYTPAGRPTAARPGAPGAAAPTAPAPKPAAPKKEDESLSLHAERALEVLDRLSTGIYTPPRPYTPAPADPPKPLTTDSPFVPLNIPDTERTEHIVGRPASDDQPNTKNIELLETKIDALSSSLNSLVGKMHRGHDNRSYSPEIDAMILSLLENEAHEEFVNRIAREVDEIVARQHAEPGEVMEQILRQYIGSSDPIRLKRFKRTVVMLVGPTGVGKTTTLAKLAAIYSINHHAKVGVITTDTYRIAAVEQLKTYTQILEIPLSIVYTPPEITDALREHEEKDVVLIDTAGKSPTDRTHEEEITELIRHSDCDEVHLVVSATTGFTGLLNILNAYSFLSDFKLIMTKLDETPAWGSILNARFLTDKPLSYTALGQNVPDDIEVADTLKIVKRLINP